MEHALEVATRMLVKSGLRSLFRTPFGEWGAVQWLLALAIVAAVAGAFYWFFLRDPAGRAMTGSRMGRRRIRP